MCSMITYLKQANFLTKVYLWYTELLTYRTVATADI